MKIRSTNGVCAMPELKNMPQAQTLAELCFEAVRQP